MAPRNTRVKVANSTTEQVPVPSAPVKTLVRTEDERHHMFIIPRTISPDARIITLPNPATSTPCRVENEDSQADENEVVWEQHSTVSQHERKPALNDGYILSDASLFVATPMDPLFFLVTLFCSTGQEEKTSYRMEDDFCDSLCESSPQMKRRLNDPGFRDLLLRRLEAVSLTQDIGDEKVFKLDLPSLVKTLFAKAQRMTADDCWPASMEEAFVKRPLEMPIMIQTQSNPQLPTPEHSQEALNVDKTLILEDPEDVVRPGNLSQAVPESIVKSMRLRTAFNFLLSSYVPPRLRPRLHKELKESNVIDFKDLDQHLEQVQAAKSELQALRSLSDNISRKRAAGDDDEAAEIRAEKRRKKEEEDKRKASESRAIKQLKKADTSGMKKLSSFFSKATPGAARSGAK